MTARPCIFGEVLFDHFPDGRRVLGGAPFNVAWHLQAFGASPFMVSKLGADEEATVVESLMSNWGMDRGGVGMDPSLPTGRVRVHIERNEPTYDIVRPAAWDAIEVPDNTPHFTLLYHGSLALRSEKSRAGCEILRQRAISGGAIVFIDVNLRKPWWDRTDVLHSLKGADWVKLNGEELDLLAPGTESQEQRALSLLERFGLNGMLLTQGSEGAEILTAEGERFETKPRAGLKFVDTVGAGDAMASVMILGLLNGWELQLSLQRAQEMASAIVGRRGATVTESAFYRKLTDSWSRNPAGTEKYNKAQ